MNRWGWASLLLIAAAFDVADGPKAFADGKRSGRCYAVRVGAADSRPRQDRSRHAPVLSAGEVKDLEIEVLLSEDDATRPVQVKLFNPRGRLYQVLDAVANESPATAREGRRPRARREVRSLVARFPVAGTQITTHGLFGEWRAEVYLDGAEAPCTRPLRFVIKP